MARIAFFRSAPNGTICPLVGFESAVVCSQHVVEAFHQLFVKLDRFSGGIALHRVKSSLCAI